MAVTQESLEDDREGETQAPQEHDRSAFENADGAALEGGQPDASIQAGSDDEEDEVPDYSHLAALLSKAGKSHVSDAFLPKRGEKDFEPTGFTGQQRALEKSRQIMFEAVSGTRINANKSLSTAIFDPATKRAIIQVARGTALASMGITVRTEVSPAEGDPVKLDPQGRPYPKYESSLQLLPEEVLYLLERGSLQCFLLQSSAGGRNPLLVPLSVQQAFANILVPGGCTREQYQTYAYLKRLGYFVQRASVAEELRRAAADKDAVRPGESGRGTTPAQLHKLAVRRGARWLGSVLKVLTEGVIDFVVARASAAGTLIRKFARSVERIKYGRLGTTACGLGKQASYHEAFSLLRVVPQYSGNSFRKLPPRSKVSQPFFHAWRPATEFKRTDPPPPEFRIAVCSARDFLVPSLAQFCDVFVRIPLPGDDARDDSDSARALQAKLRNNAAYGRSRTGPRARRGESQDTVASETRLSGLLRYVSVLCCNHFQHCPPGSAFGSEKPSHSSEAHRRPPTVNPFPPLKAGNRNFILAVVDEGTTSLLRFGESDFPAFRLV